MFFVFQVLYIKDLFGEVKLYNTPSPPNKQDHFKYNRKKN
jgi:hypothetical protein